MNEQNDRFLKDIKRLIEFAKTEREDALEPILCELHPAINSTRSSQEVTSNGGADAYAVELGGDIYEVRPMNRDNRQLYGVCENPVRPGCPAARLPTERSVLFGSDRMFTDIADVPRLRSPCGIYQVHCLCVSRSRPKAAVNTPAG